MILSDWLHSTPFILERAGMEAPQSELYLWLTFVTGKDKAYFISRSRESMDSFLSRDNIRHLEDILLRRLEREPLAYILGTTCFFGNTIRVGPGVLVPRPDSELAVEVSLALLGCLPMPWNQCSDTDPSSLKTLDKSSDVLRFMDLCTGSGCLGISVAMAALPRHSAVSGILTDISSDALYYAKGNMNHFHLQETLSLLKCDIFPDPTVMEGLWGDHQADLIIVNPPYISAADMETLMPEVMDYEPEIALRGGDDGLSFFRRILPDARLYLSDGGWLVLEHGYDQGESVPDLCRVNGYDSVLTFRDYAGNPRITIASSQRAQHPQAANSNADSNANPKERLT